MRRSLRIPVPILVLAVAAVAVACEGSSTAGVPGAGNPYPTATPYAVLPQPTIVSGEAARATPTPAAGAAAEQRYRVQPGDTLSQIAERFGTTVAAIQRRNGLSGTAVRAGDELIIPTPSPAPAAATATPAGAAGTAGRAASEGVTAYTVEAGDTAWDIARQFNTTIEELAAANGKTVETIGELRPGDRLTIPRPR